jgi:hypothetical protein
MATSQRIPKSDDSHNYGMTAKEVAAYLEKKHKRREKAESQQQPTLIAAE